MKPLSLRRPLTCDVLIFDVIGVNWLRECIPDNVAIGHLDVRNCIPIFFSPLFFFILLKTFFIEITKTTPRLTQIYLFTLFDYIDPKILLTAADNNGIVARYANSRPHLLTVFVQNALRDTAGTLEQGLNLPIYFSLGEVEADIFRRINVSCSSYMPIGSVKLGIALRDYNGSKNEYVDLCFISHFRPLMLQDSPLTLDLSIEKINRLLFLLTCQYAISNKLSLAVLSKNRDPSSLKIELDYFESLASGQPISFVKGDKGAREFLTYHAALSSQLIVHPASTLGFELFSVGQKVLFGASAVEGLVCEWGIDEYFRHLPDIVVLNSAAETEFFSKADYLLNMTTENYRNTTHDAAKRCIAMPDREYPHDVIRRWLGTHLAR